VYLIIVSVIDTYIASYKVYYLSCNFYTRPCSAISNRLILIIIVVRRIGLFVPFCCDVQSSVSATVAWYTASLQRSTQVRDRSACPRRGFTLTTTPSRLSRWQ